MFKNVEKFENKKRGKKILNIWKLEEKCWDFQEFKKKIGKLKFRKIICSAKFWKKNFNVWKLEKKFRNFQVEKKI